AWTAAPALVVFVLVLVTARTLWEVNADPPEPTSEEGRKALYVTVVGRQWWWEYRYDYYEGEPLRVRTHAGTEEGLPTANELHVPVGRPIHLTLESADVSHSFWVPRLAGKTDLIPGRTNHMTFQAREKGLYLGQCAEYCGTQHAKMLLRVYVDSEEDFKKWLENERKPSAKAGDLSSTDRENRRIFLNQSCVNCHLVRG